MARKSAADKEEPDAGKKNKPRSKPSAAPWRPVPLAWMLNAGQPAGAPNPPARILVAGVVEAFLLAASLRDAEVVAIEPDAELVKAARTAAGRRRLRHLRIEEAHADQPALGELVGGNYDLVVAHDVMHRVKDADAAFANLAAACAEDGTLYTCVRSANHPSVRLDNALSVFGLQREEIDADHAEAGPVARLLAGLGGFAPVAGRALPVELEGEGTGPAPLAAWLDRAGAAGLHLRATTLTAKTLPGTLGSGGTKLLASFPLPKLAILLDSYLQPPAVELVFARRALPEVPWSDPDSLSDWRPVARFLPLGNLQEMEPPWNKLAGVEVEIHGVLAKQNFTLSRYMLEILRRSDGRKTLAEIMDSIPHEADLAGLTGALHFLHHAFILELQVPAD